MLSENDKHNILQLMESASAGNEQEFVGRAAKFIADSNMLRVLRPVTLWEPEKVRTVLDVVLATEDVPGDIVELGVFRGGGTLLIAETLRAMSSSRVVYGIDSFEGLPEETDQDVMADGAVHYGKGKFKEASDYATTAFLMNLFMVGDHVRFIKGYFEDVLPDFVHGKDAFSMVIIDPDQYKGTLQALEAFYSKVSPGGYVLIDDYYSAYAVGVAKAVDAFLADKPETPERGGGNMALFRKR